MVHAINQFDENFVKSGIAPPILKGIKEARFETFFCLFWAVLLLSFAFIVIIVVVVSFSEVQ